jgi:hypothetical protein
MRCDPVESRKPFSVNSGAKFLALGAEQVLLRGNFALANRNQLAGLLQGSVEQLYLPASFGKCGFVAIRALQAFQLLVFKSSDFAFGKCNLVLDGLGLCGRGHRVQLTPVTVGLLAVGGNVAFQPAAQGFLAIQRGRGAARSLLSGCKRGFGLSDFARQRAGGLAQSGALQFEGLQPDEVFNERNHG